MGNSRWKSVGCVWLCLTMTSCARQDPDVQSAQEKLAGDGFASPIPLPPVAAIDAKVCIEEILQTARDKSLTFNGNAVVDLGIFHIHEGIEHTNAAEYCFNCPGERREGHIVLGQEACRKRVTGKPWPDTEQGRKDRADALLNECGEVVLSFGVCLDRTSMTLTVGSAETWCAAREQLMCINLGGPTGTHSPHQAMVQWIHLREYCPRLSSNEADHSRSYEPGKLHVSKTAEIVDAKLQDTPRCGTMSDRECKECGKRHTRCCKATEPGYNERTKGCDEGLSCEGPDGHKRCLPPAPPKAADGGADDDECGDDADAGGDELDASAVADGASEGGEPDAADDAEADASDAGADASQEQDAGIHATVDAGYLRARI